jgi:hypothetical protein
MEHTAKIVGYDGIGPKVEVYDDEGHEVSAALQPREWLGAVSASGVLRTEESRRRVGAMLQRGEELQAKYGSRLETDRA